MSHNFRDRDNSRSRSRERERRGVPHKFSPRESHRNVIKLHVGNLPLSTSEEDVLRYFQRFGRVDDVKIMRKNASGQPLRESLYGFIVMSNEEEARRALEMINHNAELGWHVSYSKEKGRFEDKGRFDDGRRSPDRSYRPRDQYRKDSDEDNRYRQYDRNRRDRSPRREYDNRRREDSYSPDRRPQERGPAQGAALMNLLNNNMNTGNPNMAADLMKILQLPPDQLSQLTNTMEKNILNGNTILVRELWIGNLPENLQDKKLSNTVEMFGEVENIEFYNKPNTSFAFVKFRKVSQASKAYEGAQSLKLLLDSPNLRVTFSDHQRRRNVVGDNIDYENDEDLTSIVYLGFNSGAFISPEGVVREMFSKYGEVLNVMVNQSPKDNSAKSYALVEMGNLNQAKAARQRLFIEDDTREKRTRLGDRNCELAILVKAKNSAHPSHPGQMQNQQGGHQGQQQFPPQQGMGRNPMYNQQGGQPYQQNQQHRPYQQGYPNQPYQQRQQYQQYPNQGQQYQQQQQQQHQGQGQYQQQRHDQPYGLGQQRHQPHYQNPRDQQYQQSHPGQYQQQPPSGPYQQGGQQYSGQRNPHYQQQQQQQQPNAPYGHQSQQSGMGDQRPYNPMGNQAPPPNAPGAMPGYPQGPQVPQQGMGQPGTGTSPIAQPGRFGSSPIQFPPNVQQQQQGAYDPNQQQNRPPVGTSPVGIRSTYSPSADISKSAEGQGAGDKKDDKKTGHLQLLDTLQSIFAQTQAQGQGEKQQPVPVVAPQKQEEEKKAPVVVEEEPDDSNQDIFWSGFITKNKQNRVGVDAYMIEGDETILKDYFNLNISHRTLFEEIEKRAKKAIVIFRPSGETHLTLFNDYLKYFVEKQRAGVVTLKKNTLYILPPCEETFKIHKFGQNELLGIFSDLSDVPKESLS